MSDFIRKSDLLERLEQGRESWLYVDSVRQIINGVPAVDAEEVVRCK